MKKQFYIISFIALFAGLFFLNPVECMAIKGSEGSLSEEDQSPSESGRGVFDLEDERYGELYDVWHMLDCDDNQCNGECIEYHYLMESAKKNPFEKIQ